MTERVKENESGDSEDELPCVIGGEGLHVDRLQTGPTSAHVDKYKNTTKSLVHCRTISLRRVDLLC